MAFIMACVKNVTYAEKMRTRIDAQASIQLLIEIINRFNTAKT